MRFNPLRRLRRGELEDEIDLLITNELTRVIRGEIRSDEARSRFLSHLQGRFRGRRELRYRKRFQRRLLMTVLAGVPGPQDDDKEAVILYLRNRVHGQSLSFADARDRVRHAARLLPDDERRRWEEALDVALNA
jgi:hypothetical protein